MFGAIFTWFMIFLTHYCFRRYHQRNGERKLSFRMRLFPYSTLLGLLLMGAVMITTYFTDAFNMTLVFGVPFLVVLTVIYGIFFRKPKTAEALRPLPKV
jgi:L-asparagine transporter-like permease